MQRNDQDHQRQELNLSSSQIDQDKYMDNNTQKILDGKKERKKTMAKNYRSLVMQSLKLRYQQGLHLQILLLIFIFLAQ